MRMLLWREVFISGIAHALGKILKNLRKALGIAIRTHATAKSRFMNNSALKVRYKIKSGYSQCRSTMTDLSGSFAARRDVAGTKDHVLDNIMRKDNFAKENVTRCQNNIKYISKVTLSHIRTVIKELKSTVEND